MSRQSRAMQSSPAIFVPQQMSLPNSMPAISIKNEEDEGQVPDIPTRNVHPQSDDDEFDEEGEGILANHEGVQYYEDSGFRIKQVTEPTVVQRSLNDLYNLCLTKYMRLDPEYQREVVWDEGRSSALIASVIQGYFIPPIIFNVLCENETLNDSSGETIPRYYRICVDGKQRLTSVRKFIDGEIGVSDSSSPPKKWYYRHPVVNGIEKQSGHNILPEATKRFFRSRMFCCYEYSDMPTVIEETMFQLVQRGMPLTPAERMRALSTKWATFGKMFEEDYPMIVNLSKQTRASGFRAIITIFCQILEVMHPSGNKRTNREGVGIKPILQASPQVLTKLLLDDQSLSEVVKATLKKVFDKFQKLVEMSSRPSTKAKTGFIIAPNSAFDPAPEFLREAKVNHVKTFSPVELLATAILLIVHMDTRTDPMLLGDIKEMRYFLRENHKDLRVNNLCWTTAWDYIDMEMIRRRGGAEAVPRRPTRRTSSANNVAQTISENKIQVHDGHVVGDTLTASDTLIDSDRQNLGDRSTLRNRRSLRGRLPVGNRSAVDDRNIAREKLAAQDNLATRVATEHSSREHRINVKSDSQKSSMANGPPLPDDTIPIYEAAESEGPAENIPPTIPARRIAIATGSQSSASAPIANQPRKRNYDIDLGAPPSFRDIKTTKKLRPV